MKGIGSQRICLDFHFADFAKGVIADFDPKKVIETFKKAGVEGFIFLVKDHWGNVYYDSELPEKLAPHLKNYKFDITRALFEEAKKAGIGMIGYYTINWEENYARVHPQHCRHDSKGNIIRQFNTLTDTNMWTFVCINSPYRDFVFRQSRELVGLFDFPAFFSDILHFGPCIDRALCYCEFCRGLWKKKYGGEMPEIFDVESRSAYIKLRDEFLADFLREYTEGLRSVRPGMLQTHNIITNPSQIKYMDYVGREAEPWGKDYYSASIQTKVHKALARGKPLDLFACRFNQLWDFTIKPEAQLEWEAATVTANGAEITIIDQTDLRGNLYPEVYEIIGRIYEKLPALRNQIAGAERIAEVGIVADGAVLKEWPIENSSFNGACRMLIEMQVPFRVIISDHLEDENLGGLQAVLLSNLEHLSESQTRALIRYLENGGCILMTAGTGERDEYGLPPAFEKSIRALPGREKTSSFKQNFIRTHFPIEMPYLRTNNPVYEFTAPQNAEVLADIVNPAMHVTDEEWISHNIHPSVQSSGFPAVFSIPVGKGTLVYFAFDLFKDYIQQDLPSFRTTVETILAAHYRPSVRGKASERIEMNFYRTSGGDIRVILTSCSPSKTIASFEAVGVATFNKATEHMNMKEVYPARNVKIEMRGKIKGVKSLQGAATSFEYDADSNVTVIHLEKLDVYDCLTISI